MYRRELLLGGVSMLSLGGCLSVARNGYCEMSDVPQGGLGLLNWDDVDRTVSITVFFDLSILRQKVYDRSIELQAESAYADEKRTIGPVVEKRGRHVLRVTVQGTGATVDHLWDVRTDSCNALLVAVRDGAPEVTPVVSSESSSTGGR